MSDTTIKLRGHHLLCLLTYIGRGYTPDFTENFDALAARITAGAPIMLIEGPDDVCAALRNDSSCGYRDAEHCLKEGATARDIQAERDINAMLGISLEIGEEFTYTKSMAESLRKLFSSGAIRKACEGCEWYGVCTDIAANGYAGAKLFPDK